MADETEDADLQLQRAYGKAIPSIKSQLGELVSLGRQSSDKAHQIANRVCALINPFQEEPQLLDPHLNEIISLVNTKAVQLLGSSKSPYDALSNSSPLHALAKIFHTLCKVRGEKVVVRFLRNEANLIDPLLTVFRIHRVYEPAASISVSDPLLADSTPELHQLAWETMYFLVLWLSHLLLAPFDLATISSIRPNANISEISTPPNLPSIAHEALMIGFKSVGSAAKQQHAGAVLLVRLCLRPDMRSLGLLDAMIQWSLDVLSSADETTQLHSFHGSLVFLGRLVASANLQEGSQYLAKIYTALNKTLNSNRTPKSLLKSAVTKKLSIKIQRNIIMQLLALKQEQNATSKRAAESMLKTTSALEEVVDFLLTSLADRDSPVRFAASKALSVITAKLDADLVEDVVGAVIDSMNEDVFTSKDGRPSLSAVDPLRWHGLTLTLSHMLFHRSPSPDQLDSVLNALYNALNFEQRSVTGTSLGTNVRDAANFGLWSLARRYSSTELQAVDGTAATTVLQRVACELVQAACLDPAGNVRRGSSAALQELIGRHPDIILEGISVVQTVEYQSVGLRKRAMIDVSLHCARLGTIYRDALLEALMDWRGLGSPDANSRDFAATSIGHLSALLPVRTRAHLISDVSNKLGKTTKGAFELRHGLVKTLASLVAEIDQQTRNSSESTPTSRDSIDSIPFLLLFGLFSNTLAVTRKDLNTTSLRPELTVSSLLVLISSLVRCYFRYRQLQVLSQRDWALVDLDGVIKCFMLCLEHTDESLLELIPDVCDSMQLVLPEDKKHILVQSCLETVGKSSAKRLPGLIIALGCFWGSWLTTESNVPTHSARILQSQILEVLQSHVASENDALRVVAVRSLSILLPAAFENGSDSEIVDCVFSCFAKALNDYTITERGDVGANVRLEGLYSIGRAVLPAAIVQRENVSACLRSVQRLSLEKMDKVRLEAARVLSAHGMVSKLALGSVSDVSNFDYFIVIIKSILEPTINSNLSVDYQVLLSGMAVAASTASASLATQARSAFYAVFSQAPRQMILDLANALSALLRIHSADDRLLLPLLEFVSFMLDAHILQRIAEASQDCAPFKWRTFLSLIQKSHYKSSSIPKLLAAVDIYRSLAFETADEGNKERLPAFQSLRSDVLKKMIELCGHPFPKVRIAAAEALWVVTEDQDLKSRDWFGGSGASSSAKQNNRAFMDALRRKHIPAALD